MTGIVKNSDKSKANVSTDYKKSIVPKAIKSIVKDREKHHAEQQSSSSLSRLLDASCDCV